MARVDLCVGRPDRAERRLTPAPTDRAKPMRAQIERLVLLARAQLQLGKSSAAGRHPQQTGHRTGPFGPDTSRCFSTTPSTCGSCFDVWRAAIRTPYLSELIASPPTRRLFPPTANRPLKLVEPLTVRERDLLGHLPTHLSQRRDRGHHVRLAQHRQIPHRSRLSETRCRVPLTSSPDGANSRASCDAASGQGVVE